jgi:hypothetical protein
MLCKPWITFAFSIHHPPRWEGRRLQMTFSTISTPFHVSKHCRPALPACTATAAQERKPVQVHCPAFLHCRLHCRLHFLHRRPKRSNGGDVSNTGEEEYSYVENFHGSRRRRVRGKNLRSPSRVCKPHRISLKNHDSLPRAQILPSDECLSTCHCPDFFGYARVVRHTHLPPLARLLPLTCLPLSKRLNATLVSRSLLTAFRSSRHFCY